MLGRIRSLFEARPRVMLSFAATVLVAGALPAVTDAVQAITPATAGNLAALVNPFIGTSSGENTFPGAAAPFGMVEWSPDTVRRVVGGGYSYDSPDINGFSLTHISGPGCAGEGDIPVLPTTGTVDPAAADAFAHDGETAEAGFYQVKLDNGITTALTATSRTGMADFTFPATAQANLLFKLGQSQTGDTGVNFTVVSDTQVQGSVTSGNFCGSGNSYTVHFDMRFSQPFTASGTYQGQTLRPGEEQLSAHAPPHHGASHATTPGLLGADGAYLTFDTTRHQTLLAKVGLSYVSAAGAAGNLKAENPAWDFASTRAATQAAWNAQLGRIRISGGSRARQVDFYTALYHASLFPNVFSDADRQYLGADGRVHTVDRGHAAFYTNISGWDIYRTQAPLEALLDPQVASDTAQSMVDVYAQDGMLPKWPQDNSETYMMGGDSADPLLAGYYAFGARNFDVGAALSDMVAQATTPNKIRPGVKYFDRLGYLPANGMYGCCMDDAAPTSMTLEYASDDFAISALAGDLGQAASQRTFLEQSQDWRNVLNPVSGFDQPRAADGSWLDGFGPARHRYFQEGSPWMYTGMVPFNLAGLTAAKGGPTAMASYLGSVLRSYTGAAGYANMANQPSIELPWEYDYIGQPDKTQATVRLIQDELWSDSPTGLDGTGRAGGNDDLGTMSAWFVWSALGLYPMTPGTSTLALGSPLFPRAVITLPSGHTLTIVGKGAADPAPYVQAASWNGDTWDKAYAPALAITQGGTLSYTLGILPDRAWASEASSAPPSWG
ncbi:MAG TPA: lectin [Streptosporangiaceae bacterium]|jgi:predicted alpha-1,2-mannosidase